MLEEFESYTGNEKAGIGRRIISFLIDYFVYYLLLVVLNFLFKGQEVNFTSISLQGFPAFIAFCCGLLLWPISEGVFGQTIGKRFMDIKVVSINNDEVSLGQAFGRFFLGIFDFMLLSGIIVASINKNNQRIGDIAAKTFVVKSKYNG